MEWKKEVIQTLVDDKKRKVINRAANQSTSINQILLRSESKYDKIQNDSAYN